MYAFLEGETFADYARRMKKEIIEALSHPNAPFDKIVKALSGGRDDSRPQVAQTMFTLEVDGDVNRSKVHRVSRSRRTKLAQSLKSRSTFLKSKETMDTASIGSTQLIFLLKRP